MISSELVVDYIYDISIGGHISTVDEDVTIIMRSGASLLMHFNITRCELISSIMPFESQSLNEFIAISSPDASIFGAPLLRGTLYKMRH